MTALTIRHAEGCDTPPCSVVEYWHDCESDTCQAEECLECGKFATDCELDND